MRCPTLSELPPPPPGKTGWPWTEESPQLPDTMPNGRPWPRVSIVTPNLNQGQFIEETIRSVLLQGYPNLEYIIMDGGSTDNSVEIIQKYEPWIAYWESKKDRGQAHAINKGFRRATGEIIAWLNSDDMYTPCSIEKAAKFLARNTNIDIVYGDCIYIDTKGSKLRDYETKDFEPLHLLISDFIPQPSTFLRKRMFSHPLLNESLNYAFDHELWLRYSNKRLIKHIHGVLSFYRLHPKSKTSSDYLFMQKEGFELSTEFVKKRKIPIDVKEKILLAMRWRLVVINWKIGKVNEATNHLRKISIEDLMQCIPLIKETILFIVGHPKSTDAYIHDIKQNLNLIKKFHKDITGSSTSELLTRLLSQYYLSLAVENNSLPLLFKAIVKDTPYFLKLIDHKLQKLIYHKVTDEKLRTDICKDPFI